MKRAVFVVMIAALVVPPASFAGGTTDPITIGVSIPYQWHPFSAAMMSAAQKTAESLGVKIVGRDANGSYRQAQGLQDLVTQKVDGILVTPIDTDSLVPAIEKAIH